MCLIFCSGGLLESDEAERVALVGALSHVLTEGDPQGPGLRAQELMEIAGLSRQGLSSQMERLRSLGFTLEPTDDDGYRLVGPLPDLVVAEAVLPLLFPHVDTCCDWVLGLPYRYQDRCESTNSLLKGDAGTSPAGAVVVTDEQTGGRGRLGRSWWSQKGKDLTFSVLLRPEIQLEQLPLLSLTAALAVAEALESLPGLDGRVQVKWPNDVLLDDRKVCGILPESSVVGGSLDYVVVGIGLNVNSDPTGLLDGLGAAEKQEWQGKPMPISVSEAVGHMVPRPSLLAFLLRCLRRRLEDPDVSATVAGLRERDALYLKDVQVMRGPPDEDLVVAGRAVGIGRGGELLVMEDSGRTVPVVAGEVTVRTAT